MHSIMMRNHMFLMAPAALPGFKADALSILSDA